MFEHKSLKSFIKHFQATRSRLEIRFCLKCRDCLDSKVPQCCGMSFRDRTLRVNDVIYRPTPCGISAQCDNELTLLTLETKSDGSVRLNIERLSNMLTRKLEDRKSTREQTLVA